MKKRTIVIFMLAVVLAQLGQGQSTGYLAQFGGGGNEVARALTIKEDDQVVLSVAFDSDWSVGGKDLSPVGREDVCLFQFDLESTSTEWHLQFGSILDDDLPLLQTMQDGSLLAVGTYGVEITIGSEKLTSAPGSQGIFLVSVTEEGVPSWTKGIEGDGVLSVGDLVDMGKEGFAITGFFGGNLYVQDTVLKAEGQTDFFIAAFDATGALKWALRAGRSGNARGKLLTRLPNDDLVVGGTFDSTIQLGGESFVSQTNDEDVFIARYSSTGSFLWGQHFGGVFDDEVEGLALGPNGSLLVFGQLIGVMRLNDTLSIQSQSVDPDLYLLRIDQQGVVRESKVFSSKSFKMAKAIEVWNEQLFGMGIFQGDWMADDFLFEQEQGIGTFWLQLDMDFVIQDGATIENSGGNVFAESLALNSRGQPTILGSFTDTLYIGGTASPSRGNFDVFLHRPGEIPTVVRLDTEQNQVKVRIFPNPAKSYFAIETDVPIERVEIYNPKGELLSIVWDHPTKIALNYPSGVYYLKVFTPSDIIVRKLVCQ